jgi:hypothetical protein
MMDHFNDDLDEMCGEIERKYPESLASYKHIDEYRPELLNMWPVIEVFNLKLDEQLEIHHFFLQITANFKKKSNFSITLKTWDQNQTRTISNNDVYLSLLFERTYEKSRKEREKKKYFYTNELKDQNQNIENEKEEAALAA